MAWILNLETASTNCSVSLYRGEKLMALREDRSPGYSHGEQLHLFIEEVIQEAGIELGQVQAVAVSKGPGSYTGLRIGVAAAKGLCFSLGIPLIAVETLRAMAAAVSADKGVLIPMLDARRMEVYSAVYDLELNPLRETRAEVLNPESFSEYTDVPEVHLLGNGAEKCRELLKHPAFRFHTDVLPSAREMGPLSYEAYRAGRFEDLAYFEPFYLKDFIVTKKKS